MNRLITIIKYNIIDIENWSDDGNPACSSSAWRHLSKDFARCDSQIAKLRNDRFMMNEGWGVEQVSSYPSWNQFYGQGYSLVPWGCLRTPRIFPEFLSFFMTAESNFDPLSADFLAAEFMHWGYLSVCSSIPHLAFNFGIDPAELSRKVVFQSFENVFWACCVMKLKELKWLLKWAIMHFLPKSYEFHFLLPAILTFPSWDFFNLYFHLHLHKTPSEANTRERTMRRFENCKGSSLSTQQIRWYSNSSKA